MVQNVHIIAIQWVNKRSRLPRFGTILKFHTNGAIASILRRNPVEQTSYRIIIEAIKGRTIVTRLVIEH